MPAKSLHKMLLAVGKGSGSFELWNCDISGRKFDKIGSFDAHYHAVSAFFLINLYIHYNVNYLILFVYKFPQVTDLAWAFDGCSLYSCSQVFYFINLSCIIIYYC